MSQETIDALLTVLMPIITALVGWLVLTLRKQVEVKTAAIKHEELRKWVTTLVMSAEQQFATFGKDEEKLAYATEQTLLFVQSLGLSLTVEQVRALIESAVKAMSIQEAATITLPATAASPSGTITTEATITSTTTPDTPATAVKTWEYQGSPV